MGSNDVFQHLSRLSKKEVWAALRELERQRAELAARESALRAVLPYASGEDDEDATPSITSMPLWRAILTVMAGTPGRRWTSTALLDELARLGAAPKGKHPKNQITNRLADLRENGKVVKNDDGTHSLASDDEALRGAPASGAGEAR